MRLLEVSICNSTTAGVYQNCGIYMQDPERSHTLSIAEYNFSESSFLATMRWPGTLI